MANQRHSTTALLVLFALIVMPLATGCQRTTSDRDIEWVQPDDASRAMLRRGGAFGLGSRGESMWLDPRTPQLYAEGHVPGAVNIPFRDLETVFPTLRDRGTIIVYGTDFSDTLAVAASKRLLDLGHSDVLTLRGGLQAWERAGNPVERAGSNSPGAKPGANPEGDPRTSSGR